MERAYGEHMIGACLSRDSDPISCDKVRSKATERGVIHTIGAT